MRRLVTDLASGVDTLTSRFPIRSLDRGHQPAAESTMPIPMWLGSIGVVMVFAAAFVVHALNMFNFPRYELDEGTYVSNAWAVQNNQIMAYPYGYGHPPIGWVQIALWTRLIGGFFTFGNALNSARVLMLLYAFASSCLVYLIARRMSGSRAIGLVAMVIFSFSPISLTYQRQVFLDNIAVFWLLLSIYLLVVSKSRLLFTVGAALAFGIAVLSKETFVILVPVMIYALRLNITRYQRMFGLITFTYTVVGLGFGLVLMALLRGELFPYSWHLPWDQHPHLSLLDTFFVQIQRSQSEGRFIDSWYTWIHADPLFMGLSVFATIFNLVIGVWKRNQLFLALASITYWALLLRGGVVLSFYIIVLIPLVALNAALAINTVVSWMRRVVRFELAGAALVICIALGILANDISQSNVALTQHSTAAQTQSMLWIRSHVSHDSVVVINSYLYMDLRQPGGAGVGEGATYPYAHVYWNMAFDPELRDGLLQSNWDRIDYIVADSEMLHDINSVGGPMMLITTALQHSILRQEFRSDDNEQFCPDCASAQLQLVISIYEVIHKTSQPSIAYRSPQNPSVTGAA